MASYSNYSKNKQSKKGYSGRKNEKKESMTKSERLMNGVAKWASYYISRPDIFAEEYLGLSLKPFQAILLFCMMHYNYTAIFASRGLGNCICPS